MYRPAPNLPCRVRRRCFSSRRLLLVPTLVTAMISTQVLAESDDSDSDRWSGNVALETRLFPYSPSFEDQDDDHIAFSASAQPEYYKSWDGGDQSFALTLFGRVDQQDDKRTHADIRELTWLKVAHTWELRVGIRKVFWGVTESQHLVDIINQTDLVENIDGEDKLGQPMINLALIHDWGTLDLYALTGFRERTFPGKSGRFRTSLPVDIKNPEYDASNKEKHIDFAARWSRVIGDWDVGISHFYGTSRQPRFKPNADFSALIPVYDLIHQTGLDIQTVQDAWLWKLEVISRSGQDGRFTALTGGFEYTLVGIFDTPSDLGILSEYLYDDRNNDTITPYEKDIMVGARLTLNDVQSTEFLFGIIQDLDSSTYYLNLEASRRLGDTWKLSVEARTFSNINHSDPLYGFRKDDYLQMELARYF